MDTIRKRYWWNFERRIMNSIFTLEQWINSATKNLAPEAISSIAKEITDHYQTSLEKYEARGISSIEAESLAVRDLGDPEKSANKFVQVYLTKEEGEKLQNMMRNPNWFGAIIGIILYGFFAVISLFLISVTPDDVFRNESSLHYISFAILFLLIFLLHFFDVFVIKNLKNKTRLSFFVKFKYNTIIFSIIPAFIYLITYVRNQEIMEKNFYVAPGILAIFAIQWLKNDYQILRKFSTAPQRNRKI
jgi:hypothetical protein